MRADDGADRPPLLDERDQTLWERANDGDIAAFEHLFRRHAGAVWNYAYRLTGSWSAAEDLTSSTFLTAWRRRGQVSLVSDSARPWLYTVTSNLARREQRSVSRFARALGRLPRSSVERDHAEDVAGQVDADRRLRMVLQAVATLPRAERQAVELCLLGNLSTADAATALGIGEVSVRSRISRARSRLRDLLNETHPEATGEEPS
jgi:RNA polymerase sigma-70 factor (ECF subfamily)